MSVALALLRTQLGELRPRIAIVLGSGLGGLVDEVENPLTVPYAEIPVFPKSGVTGHSGDLVAGTLAGVEVILLSGRVHYYEDGEAGAMRPVIEALRDLGVEVLILTNSAGSLKPEMTPGSVMLITDHINFSGVNPLIGERSEERFVGMTQAYDTDLAATFAEAATKAGEVLHSGVYMWFSGPSFETPAEVRMAGILGADAVGMSTVPETILARFMGLRVAGLSVLTNYAAGMTGGELSHEETKAMAPKGGAILARILKTALPALV